MHMTAQVAGYQGAAAFGGATSGAAAARHR